MSEPTFLELMDANIALINAELDEMEFCSTCNQLLPEYCVCPKEMAA